MTNHDADLNNFATRCFRDTADQDYITARLAYRAGLVPQFHWSAQQAIEKYMKCILLLYRIKAKNVGHSLSEALRLSKKLPFKMKLSDVTIKLIQHLDLFGPDRYLTHSWHIYGHKLPQFDLAVWELRRYCSSYDQTLKKDDGTEVKLLEKFIAMVDRYDTPKNWHKFSLSGGLLEKIINNQKNPARSALLWQNPCFGKTARSNVKSTAMLAAANSPLALQPSILKEVAQYVYIPNIKNL